MQNKVYLVIESWNGVFGSIRTVVKVFLSKRDADFFVWEKSLKDDPHCSYQVQEIEITNTYKDPLQNKRFVKERTAQIKNELKKQRECREKNNSVIDNLEAERREYES